MDDATQNQDESAGRMEPRFDTKGLKCCSGRIADLTGNGMRLLVAASNKPEIGDVQSYTFKDENHTIELSGTVRWIAPGSGFSRKCQVGIQFNDVTPSLKEALVRLAVHGNLGEAGKQLDEVEVKYPDLYAMLGVTKYASDDEIRKAYHHQARRWHPDLNSSPGASDHFETITKAYELLTNPEMRLRYDRRFGDDRGAA